MDMDKPMNEEVFFYIKISFEDFTKMKIHRNFNKDCDSHTIPTIKCIRIIYGEPHVFNEKVLLDRLDLDLDKNFLKWK